MEVGMEVSVRTWLAKAARGEGAEFLDKGDVELAEEEPRAEGPGGVVFVGDVEVVSHVGFCVCRCCPVRC